MTTTEFEQVKNLQQAPVGDSPVLYIQSPPVPNSQGGWRGPHYTESEPTYAKFQQTTVADMTVNYAEFLQLQLLRLGLCDVQFLALVRQQFDKLDVDGNESISYKELQKRCNWEKLRQGFVSEHDEAWSQEAVEAARLKAEEEEGWEEEAAVAKEQEEEAARSKAEDEETDLEGDGWCEALVKPEEDQGVRVVARDEEAARLPAEEQEAAKGETGEGEAVQVTTEKDPGVEILAEDEETATLSAEEEHGVGAVAEDDKAVRANAKDDQITYLTPKKQEETIEVIDADTEVLDSVQQLAAQMAAQQVAAQTSVLP